MTTDRQPLSPVLLSELDWNIDGIVAELRGLRDAALAARQRLGKPAKLPSRKALAGIVEGLSSALFPNRLGCAGAAGRKPGLLRRAHAGRVVA